MVDANGATERNPSQPLRVFFSHKQSDANTAKKIVEKLKEYGGNQLDFFLSAELPPATDWDDCIAQRLQDSDWLFLLYTDPDLQWDWCLYEAGYFAGQRPPKKLFTLLREGEAPKPLRRWTPVHAKKDDWVHFLKEIYWVNKLNSTLKEEVIANLAEAVLLLLEKPPVRVRFGSRLRIVVENEAIPEVKKCSAIPGNAHVIVEPGSAEPVFSELFHKHVHGSASWSQLSSNISESLRRRFDATLAAIVRGETLDSLVIPVVLQDENGSGMLVVEGFEQNAHYFSMMLSFSRTYRKDAWSTRVFASVCDLQRATDGGPGPANHVRYLIDASIRSARTDLSGWCEEYTAHFEPERAQRLIDIVKTASEYLYAVTVDRGNYLIDFWNDPRFRRAYSRMNDLAAARHVSVHRVFVVEDATFSGHDNVKCQLLQEIVAESRDPNVHEYLLRLSDADTYPERPVRSCLICDDWVASEAPGAGIAGYVAADRARVAELKAMWEWLLPRATSTSKIPWLHERTNPFR